MKVHILGAHNCEAQNMRFGCLLVDGSLALDAGGLTSSLTLSAQQKLRAVLLTHQHYDHIRDIPALAMNIYLSEATIKIHSIQSVYEALTNHLLSGELYPNFLEMPQGNPTIKFSTIEPLKTEGIEGYSVLAVPVNHAVPAVGYQVTSPDGRAVFYTGDTGPGLREYWPQLSPQLLITEVTAPNRHEGFARETGHLTPGLLKEELANFRETKGYLPQIVSIHMNPRLEAEIEAELAGVARELDSPIILAYEGMQLDL
jgi:ribonuclease BN (tRNA processing enzyme)